MKILALAIMMALTTFPVNANPRYEILTVKSVHEMWSPSGDAEDVWYIEYKDDVLMYTDIDYPLDTEAVLADVSGEVPYIINPR